MKDTFLDRDNLRRNNFGALRLVLALFVLFSHSFAAYHGGHDAGEHFFQLTRGQMDLGAFAVNAFFAISGYLITLSWLRTPRFSTFMMKRVLRIYPGFIVASIFSLIIVAPLAGAQWSTAFAPREIASSIARIVMLSAPKATGSFASAPIDVLNMSLWTIRYEFICYLLVPLVVMLLSKSGHVRSGITIIYLALLGWHATQGTYLAHTDALDLPIIGSFDIWPRFLAYFAGGMVLAFNADRIPFRHWIAALSVAAMFATAIYGQYFFFATATAGMYLVYYAAYQQNVRLFHIGEKVDLSYGVYLYAWPVQNLLVMHGRHVIGPWTVFVLTLFITLFLAALSWYLIEAPFLKKKAKLVRKQASTPGAPAPAPSDGPLAYAEPAPAVERRELLVSAGETQKV